MKTRYYNSRILVLDDDEEDYALTCELLTNIPQNNFKIEWAANYTVAIKMISTGTYDLCFVDYRLGAKTGIDFLKEVLNSNIETPVILLTGVGNRTVDLMAMEFGAYDYLVKTELNSEKLERCIRYVLDRAEAFKALRNSERKYRGIFEKSKDVIFVTDSSLNFVDVNAAVFGMLGYTMGEIIGKNLCDLAEYEDQRKVLLNALLHDYEINDFEILLKSKDGERKICLISVSFQKNEYGKTYLQGIMHDISNLKKAEKATVQSEKLAAAGRLARTIAHEVRNPLNNIALSVEQMQYLNSDEQMVFYLDVVKRNSNRINDLVNNLISSSIPTADTVLQECVLSVIMDEVLSATTDRLTLKRCKTLVSYKDQQVVIMADRERLKMAISNIIINAVEAMEDGSGELKVTLSAGKGFALLAIADNGCGISEQNIPHLFEPYFTGKRNGMGLGLTLAHNILQGHKAKIEVVSSPGQGSTFNITFPLR